MLICLINIAILWLLALLLFVSAYSKIERIKKQMALDKAAVDAAVAKVEGDVAKVVTAVADARQEIANLKQEITDMGTVNDADTQTIVDRLTAVDNALDAAVPDTQPVP